MDKNDTDNISSGSFKSDKSLKDEMEKEMEKETDKKTEEEVKTTEVKQEKKKHIE